VKKTTKSANFHENLNKWDGSRPRASPKLYRDIEIGRPRSPPIFNVYPGRGSAKIVVAPCKFSFSAPFFKALIWTVPHFHLQGKYVREVLAARTRYKAEPRRLPATTLCLSVSLSWLSVFPAFTSHFFDLISLYSSNSQDTLLS